MSWAVRANQEAAAPPEAPQEPDSARAAPWAVRPAAPRVARWELLVLFGAVAVIAIAAGMDFRGGNGLELGGVRWPAMCTSRLLLQTNCPGCGLTRSFVALVHGQFREAFLFNPVGPLVFLFVAGQIPYRAARWFHPSGPWSTSDRLLPMTIAALYLALIVQWAVYNVWRP